MTKYVAEILKQLGIDYHQYDIRNQSDEESGETWITLHAKSEVKSDSSIRSKLDNLYEGVYGRYRIFWDEKSCYIKIVGLLEINANGQQVYPTPLVDRPALFTKEDIMELWERNQEYIPELITNGDL